MNEEGMTEKIVGYILIFFGLVVISFAAYSVYRVFTGKSMPYELFNLPGISVDLTEAILGNLPQEQSQLVLNNSPGMKSEIIKADVLNKPFNLAAHLLFMGFIANVGFKIGLLGAQLARPVNVKLRAHEQDQTPKAV
jgi:galactitol-specific phosphotransferase system IIC component